LARESAAATPPLDWEVLCWERTGSEERVRCAGVRERRSLLRSSRASSRATALIALGCPSRGEDAVGFETDNTVGGVQSTLVGMETLSWLVFTGKPAPKSCVDRLRLPAKLAGGSA